MKTLYYTVEKELQNVGEVEETTGYKDIRLYDIVDNKPILITEISAENGYDTIDELNYFVEETMMDEEFETHLDKDLTYIFEPL